MRTSCFEGTSFLLGGWRWWLHNAVTIDDVTNSYTKIRIGKKRIGTIDQNLDEPQRHYAE